MEEKKEVQQRIVDSEIKKEKVSDEEFFNVLRAIAPGTNLRTAINGVLKTGKGALIVVENEALPDLIEGGFRLNSRFTPQRLIELSKMDGAIILSKDMKRIIVANALLTPDNKISTNETGTRHKAAERTAKQSGTLVVAVSERKNEITLYYKNIRYPVVDSGDLLRKANEHLHMLEKHRELFDKHLDRLNKLELRNYPSVSQAIQVIQKGRIIQKIVSELQKFIIELGKDGLLLKTRLKEIIADVERETDLVIKDYTQTDMKKSRSILEELSYEDLFSKDNILRVLAHEKMIPHVSIKGWRILSKTTMPESEIASLVKESGSLGKAINSNLGFYKNIFGDEKAQAIKSDIEHLKMNL